MALFVLLLICWLLAAGCWLLAVGCGLWAGRANLGHQNLVFIKLAKSNGCYFCGGI